MLPRTTSIWQRDSQPMASGKPGAVHNVDRYDYLVSAGPISEWPAFDRGSLERPLPDYSIWRGPLGKPDLLGGLEHLILCSTVFIEAIKDVCGDALELRSVEIGGEDWYLVSTSLSLTKNNYELIEPVWADGRLLLFNAAIQTGPAFAPIFRLEEFWNRIYVTDEAAARLEGCGFEWIDSAISPLSLLFR